MQLTGHQIKQVIDFMGGDFETDVTIEHLPERRVDSPDGEVVLEAGLYIWCTDYPDEGAVLLQEVDPDTVGDPSDYPAQDQPSGAAA